MYFSERGDCMGYAALPVQRETLLQSDSKARTCDSVAEDR